ncbi:SMR family transporter [Grimontia celer]|uniref:SMR family transporter n=1 Tax=Grimontia celer TaxID=1796497 RepID=UPI000788A5B8
MLKSEYFFIFFCVLTLSIGQILFKKISVQITDLREITSPKTILLFAIAIILYLMSTIFWVLTLRSIDLSLAYMFTSLGFVIIPIASFYIFNEPYSIKNIIGSIFVIVGIWISVK